MQLIAPLVSLLSSSSSIVRTNHFDDRRGLLLFVSSGVKEPEVDKPPECTKDDECVGTEVCAENKICVGSGELSFRLVWSGNDNLDLHVQTPCADSIVNQTFPTDVTTGGVMDLTDIGGSTTTPHVENTFFNGANYPTGIFSYSVKSVKKVGAADAWTLTVREDNKVVATQSGTGAGGPFSINVLGFGTALDNCPGI